jgi:hypothetical protein
MLAMVVMPLITLIILISGLIIGDKEESGIEICRKKRERRRLGNEKS